MAAHAFDEKYTLLDELIAEMNSHRDNATVLYRYSYDEFLTATGLNIFYFLVREKFNASKIDYAIIKYAEESEEGVDRVISAIYSIFLSYDDLNNGVQFMSDAIIPLLVFLSKQEIVDDIHKQKLLECWDFILRYKCDELILNFLEIKCEFNLIYAIKKNLVTVIPSLLSQGNYLCDGSVLDDEPAYVYYAHREKPLIYALARGRYIIAKMLIDSGFAIDIENLLFVFCDRRYRLMTSENIEENAVKFLLNCYKKLHENDFVTPDVLTKGLVFACLWGKVNIVRKLLMVGAGVNGFDDRIECDQHSSPLVAGALCYDPVQSCAVVELLLSSSIYFSKSHYIEARYCAARYNKLETKSLLDQYYSRTIFTAAAASTADVVDADLTVSGVASQSTYPNIL